MNANILPLGKPVLYYNKWTGYENREILQFFRRSTDEELARLQVGDRIWIDVDPIHPNGKVYGFESAELTQVDKDGRFHYDGGTWSGNMSRDSGSRKIFLVDDEQGLAEFAAANPLSTDVIGDTGRMASELLGTISDN